MKFNKVRSFVQAFGILLLGVLAFKTILVAQQERQTNPYFAVAPTVNHVKPDTLDVSWTLFPDFNKTTHYQVQINHTLYGSSTKATAMRLEGLQPGGVYDVSVVTYDNGSAKGVSSPTRVLMAPQSPKLLGTYEIGTSSVGIYWQKVDTALKYRIYEHPDTLLAEVAADQTKTHLTGLQSGKLYVLRMTAINSTGESFMSEPLNVQLLPPPPVFSFIEKEIGDTWFTLKWQEVANAIRYHIFVNESEVASAGASINQYRVEGLPAGTAASVRMTAVNSSGSSEQSEAVIIQLLPATPLLAVSDVSSYSCTLAWSVANGATYYKVYENNEWAIMNVPATINNVTITEHIYVGQTATYTVKAGNGTGESAHSNPVVVTYTSERGIVRENGYREQVQRLVYQFNDSLATAHKGYPVVWVYFPHELEGPSLELEAYYFDALTTMKELQDVRFVGVFTGSTVSVKGSRRKNLTWKKATAANRIQIPGNLPLVRFYGSDGLLKNMLRISMAIISPMDIFKELPEAFEKNADMIQLYQESQTRFDELHDR